MPVQLNANNTNRFSSGGLHNAVRSEGRSVDSSTSQAGEQQPRNSIITGEPETSVEAQLRELREPRDVTATTQARETETTRQADALSAQAHEESLRTSVNRTLNKGQFVDVYA